MCLAPQLPSLREQGPRATAHLAPHSQGSGRRPVRREAEDGGGQQHLRQCGGTQGQWHSTPACPARQATNHHHLTTTTIPPAPAWRRQPGQGRAQRQRGRPPLSTHVPAACRSWRPQVATWTLLLVPLPLVVIVAAALAGVAARAARAGAAPLQRRTRRARRASSGTLPPPPSTSARLGAHWRAPPRTRLAGPCGQQHAQQHGRRSAQQHPGARQPRPQRAPW